MGFSTIGEWVLKCFWSCKPIGKIKVSKRIVFLLIFWFVFSRFCSGLFITLHNKSYLFDPQVFSTPSWIKIQSYKTPQSLILKHASHSFFLTVLHSITLLIWVMIGILWNKARLSVYGSGVSCAALAHPRGVAVASRRVAREQCHESGEHTRPAHCTG